MNRQKTAEAIEVMQAYVDGAEIERSHPVQSRKFYSMTDDDPNWAWSTNNYRIKPKPREFWVEVCDGAIYHIWINRPINIAGEVIKVREVIE